MLLSDKDGKPTKIREGDLVEVRISKGDSVALLIKRGDAYLKDRKGDEFHPLLVEPIEAEIRMFIREMLGLSALDIVPVDIQENTFITWLNNLGFQISCFREGVHGVDKVYSREDDLCN